jgi:hypothetical protein
MAEVSWLCICWRKPHRRTSIGARTGTGSWDVAASANSAAAVSSDHLLLGSLIFSTKVIEIFAKIQGLEMRKAYSQKE